MANPNQRPRSGAVSTPKKPAAQPESEPTTTATNAAVPAKKPAAATTPADALEATPNKDTQTELAVPTTNSGTRLMQIVNRLGQTDDEQKKRKPGNNIVPSPKANIPPPPTPFEQLTALLMRLQARPGEAGRRLKWVQAALAEADKLDADVAKMLVHIFEHGGPENLPDGTAKDEAESPRPGPAPSDSEILKEIVNSTRAGRAVLQSVLDGRQSTTDPKEHKQAARQMMWALYERSVAKGYPFIGGMIVLDDDGKVAQFLKRGGKSAAPGLAGLPPKAPLTTNDLIQATITASADPQPTAHPYYERPSSHFQERRRESLGMDFHGRDERLPLNKRTLHFGTLKGSNSTFVKFEYYGFKTRQDQAGHTAEFIRVVVLDQKEPGFRESPSRAQIEALTLLANKYGLDGDAIVDDTLGSLSLDKSGLFWAREKIKRQLAHPERARALAELDDLIELTIVPETAETSKRSLLRWRPQAEPRTRSETSAELKKLDNPALRQGEEVILHRDELNRYFESDLRPRLPLLAEDPQDATVSGFIKRYNSLAADLRDSNIRPSAAWAQAAVQLRDEVYEKRQKDLPKGSRSGGLGTDPSLDELQQALTSILNYLRSRPAPAPSNAVITQTRTPSDPLLQGTDTTTTITTQPPATSDPSLAREDARREPDAG